MQTPLQPRPTPPHHTLTATLNLTLNPGQNGLFEDIAEGLQRAEVVVACVSDQYVLSNNCLMEFRYATNILKLPTILAVVGKGNKWRKSEVYQSHVIVHVIGHVIEWSFLRIMIFEKKFFLP